MQQCPLFPQKRTWFSTVGMSALCQKRTFAVAGLNLGALGLKRRLFFFAPWQLKRYVASTHVFCGDMLNFNNTLERDLRQLVGLFDAFGGRCIE